MFLAGGYRFRVIKVFIIRRCVIERRDSGCNERWMICLFFCLGFLEIF